MRILRELGTRGSTGWGLWDLADRCELDKGTTHRILAGLMRERLVHQRPGDRHYFLGPLIFELSVTLIDYGAFQVASRLAVKRLSRMFANSVALIYLRSSDDCVCIAREGSSSYTREGTGIKIGNLAPLLSLAGGAAILAALPVSEASEVLSRNAAKMSSLSSSRIAKMRELVLGSAQLGYIFSEGVIWQGVNSFSVPIHDSLGKVSGSIVISGTSVDYPHSKVGQVIPEMMAIAGELVAEADKLLRR